MKELKFWSSHFHAESDLADFCFYRQKNYRHPQTWCDAGRKKSKEGKRWEKKTTRHTCILFFWENSLNLKEGPSALPGSHISKKDSAVECCGGAGHRACQRPTWQKIKDADIQGIRQPVRKRTQAEMHTILQATGIIRGSQHVAVSNRQSGMGFEWAQDRFYYCEAFTVLYSRPSRSFSHKCMPWAGKLTRRKNSYYSQEMIATSRHITESTHPPSSQDV